jgi:anti-anti-sigma factor
MSINVTVKELARVDLIEVGGRVDSSTAIELGAVLSDRMGVGNNNLVVDLSGVEYMSSAGLRELVAGLKKAKTAGGDLRLCAVSERVGEILQLAGLDAIFQIFDDQVSAVGSF